MRHKQNGGYLQWSIDNGNSRVNAEVHVDWYNLEVKFAKLLWTILAILIVYSWH